MPTSRIDIPHIGPRQALRQALVVLLLLACAPAVWAQTPVSLYQSFVGNMNFQVTGGSLRTQPNTIDACAVSATSSNPIGGIPATATIVAAYLYWAGSGSAVDNVVTLNGAPVVADRTFTATFTAFSTDFDFFSGFSDITAGFAGNGLYTFGGLTVNTGAPHCGSQAVVAGWSLVVVYEDAAEDLRAVNVFDGFQFFRGSSLTLTPNNFRIPPAPVNGRYAIVAWEGDPQNSGPLNGFSESHTFNGIALDDGLVPPGSNPVVQQYDGTVNSLGQINQYGVDVDSFDISPYLTPGDTSAATVFNSGGNLVLLTAEIASTTTEPVVDLSISKSHTGNFSVGSNGDYLIQIANAGPEPEANLITVADSLPAGLTYVSGTGSGWSCGNVGQDVTCTHPGPVPAEAV